jgi:hypothetical protein
VRLGERHGYRQDKEDLHASTSFIVRCVTYVPFHIFGLLSLARYLPKQVSLRLAVQCVQRGDEDVDADVHARSDGSSISIGRVPRENARVCGNHLSG